MLGVPLFADGKPQLLQETREAGDHPIPDQWEDKVLEGPENGVPEKPGDELFREVDLEEPQEAGAEGDKIPQILLGKKRRKGGMNAGKLPLLKEACQDCAFDFRGTNCKQAATTLKAVQCVYTRIRLLNFGVRRIHTNSGREFANSMLEKWAVARAFRLTAMILVPMAAWSR